MRLLKISLLFLSMTKHVYALDNPFSNLFEPEDFLTDEPISDKKLTHSPKQIPVQSTLKKSNIETYPSRRDRSFFKSWTNVGTEETSAFDWKDLKFIGHETNGNQARGIFFSKNMGKFYLNPGEEIATDIKLLKLGDQQAKVRVYSYRADGARGYQDYTLDRVEL